jgi:hypothetical protein
MVSIHPDPNGPFSWMPHANLGLTNGYPDSVSPTCRQSQTQEHSNLLTLEVPVWGGGVR